MERKTQHTIPMKAAQSLVWLFCFVFWLSGFAKADQITLNDGFEYNGILVHTYNHFPDGGVFIARVQQEGQQTPLDHPIEAERIQAIRFEDPDFTTPGSPRTYRLANIRLISGQILENIIVNTIERQEKTLVITLKPDEVFPHNGASSLMLTEISEILLSVRETVPPMVVSKIAEKPTPTPRPVLTPVPVEENPLDQPLGTQLLGGGNYVGEEVIGGMDLDEDVEVDYSYEEEESSFLDDSFSESTSWFTIPVIGIGVGVVSLLVYLIFTSISGGIYLFFASRIEGVNDFPLWKSFIAAGALAVFPLISFLLCAYFIPYFGFAIGLMTVYGVSRAIVMGAMEIMEEKAEGVLWTFMLVQILVFFLSTNYL